MSESFMDSIFSSPDFRTESTPCLSLLWLCSSVSTKESAKMESKASTSDFMSASTHLFSRCMSACLVASAPCAGPFFAILAGVRTTVARSRTAVSVCFMKFPPDANCALDSGWASRRCREGPRSTTRPKECQLTTEILREQRLACYGCLNFLFVDVEVRVDVLHVVVLFHSFHHAQHLLRLLARELDVVLRHKRYFGRRGRNSTRHERFANFFHFFRRRHYFPERAVVPQIVRAGVED